MNKNKTNEIKSLLQFIYDTETTSGIWDRLMAILEKQAEGKGQSAFTNKDALLITYGDMFSPAEGDRKSSGLTRVFNFLKRWNNDSFTYVHILPFHPYSSDDGFSVIDYRQVDERFGSWEDIERLGHEVKLVFDLVINHGSVKSKWFQGFLNNDKRFRKWFIQKPWNYDYSMVVRPRTHPLLTHFTSADGTILYVWTTFSSDQVDYDFSNPDVLIEFIIILLEYINRGARIVRLDAIAYLWKEDGTSCLHHPKTHGVVKLLRAVIDALNLDVKILTETNVPHEQNISYFGNNDEAHMVYNFALPPLVLHAVISGDSMPLREWAKTLPKPEPGKLFVNFLASHDGVGLTPAKGLVDDDAFKATLGEAQKRGALISYKTTPAGQIPYELNCSYSSVVAPESMGPVELRCRAFIATQAVLLSIPGLPAVYFHSFIGSEAWTDGPGLLGYNRAINREKPMIDKVEEALQDPASFRAQVYRNFQSLFEFRQNEEAFHPECGFTVLESDRSVFALLRGPGRQGRMVLCAHNLAGRKASVSVPAEYHFRKENKPLELEPWETRWIAYGGGKENRELSTIN